MKDTNPKKPEQTADSPKAIDIPTRTKPSRKIDAGIIAQMAQLVAKMLTESEAARRLSIKPRTWFDFKSRNGRTQQFADLLEAYRANRIESLIDRIEKSANGIDVKYPDFRAALALLKITDQKRFGDAPSVEVTNHQTAITIACGGTDALAKLVAQSAETARAMLASRQAQPKALPAPEHYE